MPYEMLNDLKLSKEKIEMVGIDWQGLRHPKTHFDSSATKLRKISCKTFYRKTFFNLFHRLASNILSRHCIKRVQIRCLFWSVFSCIPELSLLSCRIQKQPPEVFFEKRCSQKFRRIHKKTPRLQLY